MSKWSAWLLPLMLACSGDQPPTQETPEVVPEQLGAEVVPSLVSESDVVSGHTQGVISRKRAIRVRFVRDLAPEGLGKVPAGAVKITPAVPSEVVWIGPRELEVRAEGDLPQGTRLAVHVELGKLDRSLKGEVIDFAVDVIKQSFWTQTVGLESDASDPAEQTFTAVLRTADVADAAAVEQLVTAKQDNRSLPIAWTHGDEGREHRFVVSDIQRLEAASVALLSFDGSALGLQDHSERKIEIPAVSQFELISSRAVTSGERHIELRFSDPIDPKQDLRGIIKVQGRSGLRTDVSGSVVTIHGAGWSSTETVIIEGLRNSLKRAFGERLSIEVSFEPIKPAVRFVGEGVILPTTASLTLPIEAVNVGRIMVEALAIDEGNVPQFLQINELDGDSEIERVGRVVWKDSVVVQQDANSSNRWVRLGLDLSALVAQHPNGVYRLQLSFVRADVAYDCPPLPEEIPQPEVADDGDWEELGSREQSYWDMWNGEGVSPWEAWDNRHDPCHVGYYRPYDDHDVRAGRNVVVSDLGLMAKQGEDGTITVVATDIRTAQPIKGAALRLLDFQQGELDTAITDARGFATLRSDRKPFLIEAGANGQASWLRLSQGSSLSVSHFDTAGVKVTDGLKGFLYGERGVWRPGDPIFLTMILTDETGRLPSDHPVHFELYDPRGRLADHKVVTEGLNGFYRLYTETKADDPTGTWLAKARVGAVTFTKSLQVETVIPNRLSIDLDFGTDMIRGPDATLDATLESRWLHGAKAPGFEASVEVSLRPKTTAFAGYDDFTFADLVHRADTEPTEIFSGRLDDEGKAQITSKIPIPPGTPGMVDAVFFTRVFEPSGAASRQQISVPLSPHARYVGIKTPKGDAARGMLLTDIDHPVEIVLVDADGKPAGDGTVEVALYEVSWRWWWEKGSEVFSDYAGGTSKNAVAKGTVAVKGGKGQWKLRVDYPQWGRYLLVARDKSGSHTASKLMYIDWPGWAGRGQDDNPGGASVLSVTADDSEVEVGEDIILRIPTAQQGRVLVTLENGTGVLESSWVEPNGETTVYKTKARPDMAPNIYAHVTFVQPHSAGNDLPIRLYGVVPVEVVDPATTLTPIVKTAEVFEPDSEVKITVSESKGRAMTYTLAVVDEGLLGLTSFRTPDPWATFFAREALGVRTWDVFDSVVGGYGGALEGLIAVGGDGTAEQAPPERQNRFRPVVEVSGPFELAKGAKAEHEVKIGSYVGKVRVMVVAGQDGAYGKADVGVPVKKPLMVLATLPRVVGPGERVRMPVDVFAMEEGIRTVEVSVKTVGGLELMREGAARLSFASPGDKLVGFDLKVGDELGPVTVIVSAEGGGETAEQRITLEVRHPGQPITETTGTQLLAGKTWTSPVMALGIPGSHTALVEISRTPPVDLGRHLDDLIRYPHGCIEQTTSGAFPQLLLTELMDVPEERARKIPHNIRRALARIRSMQHDSGGFGYWPGAVEESDWGTTYAGHFMIEAERGGFLLPPGMRDSWVSYQTTVADRWVKGEARGDLDQAYRLYTLALAGEPAVGAMNRLRETNLSVSARWRLAAAYQLAGQREVAQGLVNGFGFEVPDYDVPGHTYGSTARDHAMILETLVLIGDEKRALELATKISDELEQDYVRTTQTTAWSLLAMSRFALLGQGEINAAWSLDGKSHKISSSKPFLQVPLEPGAGAEDQLSLENLSAGPLFVRLIRTGLPAVGTEQPSSNQLSISVEYQTSQGAPMGPLRVEQGSDFSALVTVSNHGGPLDDLALSQILPSGWEVHGTGSGSGDGYDYREVRDDRVYTYFDLGKSESRTFKVGLHASYLGRYYLAPLHVEAMYDPTIQATKPGAWSEVVQAGVSL